MAFVFFPPFHVSYCYSLVQVGLPNVGKSTLFNTLTKMAIPAENFPFCTIEPNEARVNVPDERFEWLCQLFKPKSEVCNVTHTIVGESIYIFIFYLLIYIHAVINSCSSVCWACHTLLVCPFFMDQCIMFLDLFVGSVI
jgi:hypothetical protein